MKRMKKLLALVLTVILAVSLATPAFAADDGSITINGVNENAVYAVYRLLDLESYNLTSGAYSYKANSAWTAFFATDAAKAYMTFDDAGYATWVAGDSETKTIEFSKLALQYAKDNDIAPVEASKEENDAGELVATGDFVVSGNTGVFSDLPLGYYLVDTTMGALCGLTTTNPDASVNAKNGIPVVDKQVKEDSTNQWGGNNTADIGQIVEFRTTISVHPGAENFVLHDNMDEGLTFDKVTKVEHIETSINKTTVLTQKTSAESAGDYTVITSGTADGCTFEVQFTKAFCDSLEANDKIIVYYQAMLNRNALIEDANENEAWLEFGDNHFTTHDKTETKTFSIDIVKTDSQNTLITGAEFKIYDAMTGGNEIEVVPLMENDDTTPVLDANGNPMYRRAREDETGVAIVVTDGQVTVVGFDNGTYYLEETVAPAGYNKLTERQKFIIADESLVAVYNDGVFSTGSGVHVVNKTGTMLPETGGIGTTLFYAFGGILVAAAVVLLITRKRMGETD